MAKRSKPSKENPLKNRMTKNFTTSLEKVQFEVLRAAKLMPRAGKHADILKEINEAGAQVAEKVEGILKRISKLPDNFKAERVIASKAIEPGCLVVFKEEFRDRAKEMAGITDASKPIKVLKAGSGPRPWVTLDTPGKQTIVERSRVELYREEAA